VPKPHRENYSRTLRQIQYYFFTLTALHSPFSNTFSESMIGVAFLLCDMVATTGHLLTVILLTISKASIVTASDKHTSPITTG
jgi:hypothetical protein